MIDTLTGEITIGSPSLKIRPSFTRDDLAALPIPRQPQIAHGPYHSYSLGTQSIGNETFFVALYFYDQKLESVELAISAKEFGTSWDDWSEEKELKRKEAHDNWLTAHTGRAACAYDWGEIGS